MILRCLLRYKGEDLSSQSRHHLKDKTAEASRNHIGISLDRSQSSRHVVQGLRVSRTRQIGRLNCTQQTSTDLPQIRLILAVDLPGRFL